MTASGDDQLVVGFTDGNQTKVYPVPSDRLLHIEAEAKIGFVVINDNQGKTVYSAQYNKTVDVSGLAQGIYYLQLLDTDQKVVDQKKIWVK